MRNNRPTAALSTKCCCALNYANVVELVAGNNRWGTIETRRQRATEFDVYHSNRQCDGASIMNSEATIYLWRKSTLKESWFYPRRAGGNSRVIYIT